jgi:hypothetical protein
MAATIAIYNPAGHERPGHIVIPWSEFQRHCPAADYPENGFALQDRANREIPYQIDRIDPADPTRKFLVVGLDAAVPAGPEDCSRPATTLAISRRHSSPFPHKAYAHKARSGIELSNGKLTTYISFSRIHDNPNKPWYAGAATTVQLNCREVLSFGDDFKKHDPEKRCMQIDHLYLPSHAQAPYLDVKVELYNQDYEYVAHSSGPVRATVTMRSVPFPYAYTDGAKGGDCTVQCRLYRAVSLYAGADYILEDLYIKADSGGRREAQSNVPRFMARYYSHIDLGHVPHIFQFANIPGWFALGAGELLGGKPGYGFATSSRAASVAYPHRDTSVLYHDPVHYKEFSWLLFPCICATNMHLFMHKIGTDFDDETGRRWYDLIYRGLWARMGSEI